MENNRLFTFGCSFTNYNWATWADIIGGEFLYYQNWGVRGAGNHCIFNSIIECNQRNCFSKDDTIAIMWSGITREDRYINNRWLTGGNVYNNRFYNEDFVKKYVDNRGFLIRDMAFIKATIDLLDHWGVKYIMFSMIPLNAINDNNFIQITAENNDVLELYNDTIKLIRPSVYEVIFNSNWTSRTTKIDRTRYDNICKKSWPTYQDYLEGKNIPELDLKEIIHYETIGRDPHPSPIEHLEYLSKVYPEFNISQRTIDIINADRYNAKVRPESKIITRF